MRPSLAYSPLTGTVYVLLRNGQKRAVPEAEVVAVIAGYLDDHHLTVTKPDGTRVRYGVRDDCALCGGRGTRLVDDGPIPCPRCKGAP